MVLCCMCGVRLHGGNASSASVCSESGLLAAVCHVESGRMPRGVPPYCMWSAVAHHLPYAPTNALWHCCAVRQWLIDDAPGGVGRLEKGLWGKRKRRSKDRLVSFG